MRTLVLQLSDAWSWLRELMAAWSVRRDSAPLDGIDRVEHFVATRSALITQKKLYGYLQERMHCRSGSLPCMSSPRPWPT